MADKRGKRRNTTLVKVLRYLRTHTVGKLRRGKGKK